MTIRIETLHDPEDYKKIPAVQISAWGFDDIEAEPHQLMTRVQKYGGLVQGLFLENELVGFSYAIIGRWQGEYFIYSHMTAVKREFQGKGFGFMLKKAQREEILKMDYSMIRWNFDPLESTNAFFNVHRLGVVSDEYERNIYGMGESGLHKGMVTDRLIAAWEIDSPRVEACLAHKREPVIWVRPQPPVIADFSRSPAFIEIPRDIRSLKKENLPAAVEWRRRTGEQFEAAFAAGFQVREIVFNMDRTRFYYQLEWT